MVIYIEIRQHKKFKEIFKRVVVSNSPLLKLNFKLLIDLVSLRNFRRKFIAEGKVWKLNYVGVVNPISTKFPSGHSEMFTCIRLEEFVIKFDAQHKIITLIDFLHSFIYLQSDLMTLSALLLPLFSFLRHHHRSTVSLLIHKLEIDVKSHRSRYRNSSLQKDIRWIEEENYFYILYVSEWVALME